MAEDRNFDELFERFSRNIKDSGKGRLRETLLREDLESTVPNLRQGSLRVLDGGCGLGDMGLWLAEIGHNVIASDISPKMVAHTRQMADAAGCGARLQAVQAPVQAMLEAGQSYDLICIHAVLEWLDQPYEVLRLLPAALRPGGWVSLSIYNLHRSVFNSLIKGNLDKIKRDDFGCEHRGSMTPPHPIVPERVVQELAEQGLQLELHAGLRCFYDYIPPQIKDERGYDDILFLERRYRKEAPYRDFARYVHFIARKL